LRLIGPSAGDGLCEAWIAPGSVETSIPGRVLSMPKQYPRELRERAVRQTRPFNLCSDHSPLSALAGIPGLVIAA